MRYLSFFLLSFIFTLGQQSPQFFKIFLFLLLFFFFFLVLWTKLGDPFVSQIPRGVCESHSPGEVLGCIYAICSVCWSSYRQFLVAVISLPLHFSMLSSSRCNNASTLSSMLASPLPLSFLDTYSLSTSSLGCKALCVLISFLVLWSICFWSSLVESLIRETSRVFIPLIRSLQYSFVSSSFLVLTRYSFFKFFFFPFPLVWWCQHPIFPSIYYYYYHYYFNLCQFFTLVLAGGVFH